jgi:hypothetical protein
MDRRNRHLLQPPVGNKICIKNLELHCNACCRPNARKDYHYNETEELFYQLEGSIKIVIQEEGVRKEMEQCGRYVFASCQCSSLSSAFSGFNRFSNRTQTSWEKVTDGLYGTATTATTNCTSKI